MKIPFNKPYSFGNELTYIKEVVDSGKLSGDGVFTKKCQTYFENKYGFKNTLLTTSCTDALEMAAILLDIKEGDEVIIPSYAFVSTANPFVLRGAKIVFADSMMNHPNIDVKKIEALITNKTKAIVLIHYAGVACEMDEIMELAIRKKIFVIEDAAQAINSYYKEKPLGSIGHLSAFSFHDTKNITCGEGGMLVVNDDRFFKRAEIIREKGTNRRAFFNGEVDKYGWVDIGSSFLLSDILAAFLFAQCEQVDNIHSKRNNLWKNYFQHLNQLKENGKIELPNIPDYATNNAHVFYLVCGNEIERKKLIKHLNENNISAVFHYSSLHKSNYYLSKHDGRQLPNSDRYTDCLLRLPLYYEMKDTTIELICNCIKQFYNK